MSNDLLNEMSLILKQEQEISGRHSYFQMKYFIIGKEPTMQSKMWQCLRELKSRNDSIKNIIHEIDDVNDQIELLNMYIEKRELKEDQYPTTDKFISKKRAIIKRQLKRKLEHTVESLNQLIEKKKWIEQEIEFFLETFKGLSKIEPLKPFDDFDAQCEYWNKKLSEKFNLKRLLQNPLDFELVDTILSLPDIIPVKQEIMNSLTKTKSLIESKIPKELNGK